MITGKTVTRTANKFQLVMATFNLENRMFSVLYRACDANGNYIEGPDVEHSVQGEDFDQMVEQFGIEAKIDALVKNTLP